MNHKLSDTLYLDKDVPGWVANEVKELESERDRIVDALYDLRVSASDYEMTKSIFYDRISEDKESELDDYKKAEEALDLVLDRVDEIIETYKKIRNREST